MGKLDNSPRKRAYIGIWEIEQTGKYTHVSPRRWNERLKWIDARNQGAGGRAQKTDGRKSWENLKLEIIGWRHEYGIR